MSAIEAVFLTSSVLTIAYGLIVVVINPWRNINRAFAIAAVVSAVWLFCVFMAIRTGAAKPTHISDDQTLFWLRMNIAVIPFLIWALSLIKLTILEEAAMGRLLLRSSPLIAVSCGLSFLAFSAYNIPSDSTPQMPVRGAGYFIQAILIGSICAGILWQALRQSKKLQGIRRLEMKFFLITTCLSALIILSTHTVGRLFGFPVLLYVGPLVILISGGLTIWAICYHRVFDARQVFVTLSCRLSTLVVFTVCILITNFFLHRNLSEPVRLLVSACCGGLLAVYWNRKVCEWLDLDAKCLLAAARTRIIEWSREAADEDKLSLQFATFLRTWCQAESVTVHTLESHEPPGAVLKTSDYPRAYPFLCQTGYITVETLSRRRPDREISVSKALLTERNVGALIAVPRGSHSPSCLVALGHKHSLRPYTYPDIQLLIELVEVMDNILTHSRVAARTAEIEKMESAAMMSRGLAHDLNNLATPVSTFLLHMEGRVAPGTAEADVLADAKHSIRVMQDYIRESLFFARRLVPNFQPLSTRELFATTIKVTQTRAQGRGINVRVPDEIDIRFCADQTLLQRLMQNLVLNAIDASLRAGSVMLSASIDGGERVSLRVTDQGSGIPSEIMDRIFEPYFTTKDTGNEVRGMGLGLAICLKISDLHGGMLQASNAPSGGAVFTVTLPINPKEPANPVASTQLKQTPSPIGVIPDTSSVERCHPTSLI